MRGKRRIGTLAFLVSLAPFVSWGERSPAGHEEGGSVASCRTISSEELSIYLPEDRRTEIVFYCRRPDCTRNPMAVGSAAARGYRSVSQYDGGWEDWSEKGYPVETGSSGRNGTPGGGGAGLPTLEDLIDVTGLNESGPDWRVIVQEIGADEGHIRLGQSKWLMYFLHWRPLTDADRSLTVDYVRNHMLHFWGQSMDFELANIDGEMEVCGHSAVLTEGSVMGGAVYTRFIVWNCPETGRQFTADCNINLRRKTPRELLDLQRTITESIRCHESAPHPGVPPVLSQEYLSYAWNVSFRIPSSWRTADYVSREWFPHGMSIQSGSLWTLLTDSVKRLELVWRESVDETAPDEMFRHFMGICAGPVTFETTTSRIIEWDIEGIEERGGVWTAEGTYRFHQKVENTDRSAVSTFRFKGFLWRDGRKAYFLLASLVQITEFWNIPNDLSPSEETFNRFVEEEILPNIKIARKIIPPAMD
jgi:rhodanese-related sulfurtransferase